MVADSTGRIAVAHETPIRDVAVELWEGTSWRTLPILPGKIFGDDVENVPNQTAPSVSLDKTGAPVVAFSKLDFRTGRVDVHVAVWRDDAWRDVGGSEPGGGSNSDAVSFSPSLATRGDVACVAWHENGAGSFQVLMRCAEL